MMQDILNQLGIKPSNVGTATGKEWIASQGKVIESFSPVDGKKIAEVVATDDAAYEQVIKKASEAFLEWRLWPSPKRGDVVRQFAEALRKYKEPLGTLVSYEMGK